MVGTFSQLNGCSIFGVALEIMSLASLYFSRTLFNNQSISMWFFHAHSLSIWCHISRMLFYWWNDLDQIGKLFLQICNSTGMLIANGVSLWPNSNGFTCTNHNGNSLTDFVLLFEGILDCIHKLSLGEWTSEFDH